VKHQRGANDDLREKGKMPFEAFATCGWRCLQSGIGMFVL